MVSLTISRVCPCGVEFEPKRRNQKYHERACQKRTTNHTMRDAYRAEHDIDFVSFDGEGVDRPDGKHEYVMLSAGDVTLTNRDGSELQWWQIFPFLYEQFLAQRGKATIGFYLAYDFTQWTKTFPESRGLALWNSEEIAKRKPKTRRRPDPFPVYITAPDGMTWECDQLNKKRFKLRPHAHQPTQRDPHKCACHDVFVKPIPKTPEISWMYICDAGPFWQASFLTAIDEKTWPDGFVSAEEYRVIREGKANRSRQTHAYGSTDYFEDMMTYNVMENRILSRIMRELNRGFRQMNVRIPLRKFYGPGQAAQAWMDYIGAPTRELVESCVPSSLLEAARRTYYGGWFEIFAHGHIPGVTYEYDINSAYPAIIATLPCLRHITPLIGAGEASEYPEYCMMNVTVRSDDKWSGAMPNRNKNGWIDRPRIVTGWYWRHELEAAQRAGLIAEMTVHAWTGFNVTCKCAPPYGQIADLYRLRKKAGKNTAIGKAYKLVYNSVYGKLCQHVGSPKYSNYIYASLITAGCRTRILDAIATHPEGTNALLMVATDGVYFSSPHPTLTQSGELGEWEGQEKTGMCLFMPGVYWDDETRKRIAQNKSIKVKSRGVSGRYLAKGIPGIDEQFNRWSDTEFTWPTAQLEIEFTFMGATLAAFRKKWDEAGSVNHNLTRTIVANPRRKRNDDSMLIVNGIYRTGPHPGTEGEESVPYDPKIATDDERERMWFEMEEYTTTDDDLPNVLRDLFESRG